LEWSGWGSLGSSPTTAPLSAALSAFGRFCRSSNIAALQQQQQHCSIAAATATATAAVFPKHYNRFLLLAIYFILLSRLPSPDGHLVWVGWSLFGWGESRIGFDDNKCAGSIVSGCEKCAGNDFDIAKVQLSLANIFSDLGSPMRTGEKIILLL